MNHSADVERIWFHATDPNGCVMVMRNGGNPGVDILEELNVAISRVADENASRDSLARVVTGACAIFVKFRWECIERMEGEENFAELKRLVLEIGQHAFDILLGEDVWSA